MPTNADTRAVDTSVAVAALDGSHAVHLICSDSVSSGVSGGAVYDALVGEAARSSERRLLTRGLPARRPTTSSASTTNSSACNPSARP